MHRARLAEEAGAELLEDAVAIDEDLQEAPDGVGIVGSVRGVFGKLHRIRQFVRHLVDGNGNAEFGERRHAWRIEAGDGVTGQRKCRCAPSLVAMRKRWSTKSKSIWNVRAPSGTGDVVNPRGVT